MAASGLRIGPYALAAAACLAAVAIGIRYGRRGAEAPPPAPATASARPAQPDVGQVVAGLEARLKEEPGNAEGWRMLGWANFNIGHYAEAARAYTRQTALAPANGDAWAALGESLVYAQKGGVPDAAAQAFERALAIAPKDPRARYFLGVRRDLAGDHRGAIDLWLAVLRDAPAGAPYNQSVRQLIEQVATREKIDVAGRLPPAGPAAAASPGPSEAQVADAARLPAADQTAMAQGMVDRLAARLAANPRDEDGWLRLMRARTVLGDKAGASKALQQARQAFTGDAAALGRIDAGAKALEVK